MLKIIRRKKIKKVLTIRIVCGIIITEREVIKVMFWIVEYDNGYFNDYKGEKHLDVCIRYFQKEKNAKEFYNAEKKRLSAITDEGFDNIQMYYEFFAD